MLPRPYSFLESVANKNSSLCEVIVDENHGFEHEKIKDENEVIVFCETRIGIYCPKCNNAHYGNISGDGTILTSKSFFEWISAHKCQDSVTYSNCAKNLIDGVSPFSRQFVVAGDVVKYNLANAVRLFKASSRLSQRPTLKAEPKASSPSKKRKSIPIPSPEVVNEVELISPISPLPTSLPIAPSLSVTASITSESPPPHSSPALAAPLSASSALEQENPVRKRKRSSRRGEKKRQETATDLITQDALEEKENATTSPLPLSPISPLSPPSLSLSTSARNEKGQTKKKVREEPNEGGKRSPKKSDKKQSTLLPSSTADASPASLPPADISLSPSPPIEGEEEPKISSNKKRHTEMGEKSTLLPEQRKGEKGEREEKGSERGEKKKRLSLKKNSTKEEDWNQLMANVSDVYGEFQRASQRKSKKTKQESPARAPLPSLPMELSPLAPSPFISSPPPLPVSPPLPPSPLSPPLLAPVTALSPPVEEKKATPKRRQSAQKKKKGEREEKGELELDERSEQASSCEDDPGKAEGKAKKKTRGKKQSASPEIVIQQSLDTLFNLPQRVVYDENPVVVPRGKRKASPKKSLSPKKSVEDDAKNSFKQKLLSQALQNSEKVNTQIAEKKKIQLDLSVLDALDGIESDNDYL